MRPIPAGGKKKSAVLQNHSIDMAVVPLRSGSPVGVHQPLDSIPDPSDVLGHLGVNPVFAFACAAFTPAHNTGDKIGVVVGRHMWPAAVTLAGILLCLVIAGAEHAGRDAQRGGLDAD